MSYDPADMVMMTKTGIANPAGPIPRATYEAIYRPQGWTLIDDAVLPASPLTPVMVLGTPTVDLPNLVWDPTVGAFRPGIAGAGIADSSNLARHPLRVERTPR